MGTYFFHLHQCGSDVTHDAVGRDAPNAAAARAIAIDQARAFMATEVAEGRLCLSCWIVVTDVRGNYVLTLHFGEAISVQSDDCQSEPAAAIETHSGG